MKAYLQSIAPGTSSPRNTKLGSVRQVMAAYLDALEKIGSSAKVTLHGIHIYVNGQPITLHEVKERTRAINDRFDPPTVFFVGCFMSAKRIAKDRGVEEPKIIFRREQLEGLRGRLRFVLCGVVSLLPEWPQIHEAINRLRIGNDVEVQKG